MSIMIDICASITIKNKFINWIIQILFWLLNVFIVLKVVLSISSGYLPIYSFLFFIGGYLIYIYFIKKSFLKMIKNVKTGYRKSKKSIMAVILPITFAKKIFSIFKKIFKIIFKKKIKVNNNIDVTQ